MREAIEAYATILAKSTGEVPAADVAWKLRQILADPNSGVPDAEVKTGADVTRREWESRVEDLDRARRNISARIIASAHLLDTPFSNAPDQSPWTLFKRDMSRLDAAVRALTRPTEETGPALVVRPDDVVVIHPNAYDDRLFVHGRDIAVVHPTEETRHPFQQLANVSVRVCECGKWPDHHIHTGDRPACGCDACRSARTTIPTEETGDTP